MTSSCPGTVVLRVVRVMTRPLAVRKVLARPPNQPEDIDVTNANGRCVGGCHNMRWYN